MFFDDHVIYLVKKCNFPHVKQPDGKSFNLEAELLAFCNQPETIAEAESFGIAGRRPGCTTRMYLGINEHRCAKSIVCRSYDELYVEHFPTGNPLVFHDYVSLA